MSNTLPTYGPPNLDKRFLVAQLLSWYPSHKGNVHLLTELVEEYVRLWRMVLSYPHRRVVAPGPILAVQRVHFHHKEQYFFDCMDYFNKFIPLRSIAWGGVRDHTGTHDTVTVYNDLYKSEPPMAWSDMTGLYKLGYKSFKLV